ncbi:MAG TPA: O-methyltransferase [Candidatus Polarisedimenticolaceae bacterium]|nr:O-methyltransferase [Candidatus Polarisedimenticolaceae bacterium]
MDLVQPDIDRYLAAFAAHDDPVLRRMEAIAAERDFPIVGPQVGRLLEMAARACGAQRVLELGSGFGYSAYWFLRGTGPAGTVMLTEGSAENAKSAEAYLTRGGFSGRFRIEVGDGLAIAEALEPPFDIVFCDIDKHDYPKALPIARRLVRPGGLFIIDNMLWDGRVLNPAPDDHVTRGVLELTAALKSAPDFAVSIVPIRDGVAIATRLAP